MRRSEYEYATIRILLPLIVVYYAACGVLWLMGFITIWAIEMVFGK